MTTYTYELILENTSGDVFRKPTLVRVPSSVDFGRARVMKSRVQKVLDYFLERDRIEAARA